MSERANPAVSAAASAPDTAQLRRVDRILGELRRGTPVVLHDRTRAVLVSAVDTLAPDALAELHTAAGGPPELVLTAERAQRLGLDDGRGDGGDMALSGRDLGESELLALADPWGPAPADVAARVATRRAGPLAGAALQATKLARLLPAALQAHLETTDPVGWAHARDLLAASAEDIAGYRGVVARRLCEVAAARVPLKGAENARIRAFRPTDGGTEHLGIVIGEPQPGEPALVRLHSECLTGDLLGSLRCDCGDQLRGAIDTIAETGAGVLLYLAQEGRGIGLVNKLRAYRLQDAGADTLDANGVLGFDPDERIYAPAAAMLRTMGFDRVRLLTNNPEKVTALSRHGITVSERVPHRFPANPHSAAYIATKAERFGHLF
jgi:GTP cyclohydrolase II